MVTPERLEGYGLLALEVLRQELGTFVVGTEVREDDDHTGEPALFFVAVLDDSAPIELSDRFVKAQVRLRDALHQRGEPRFPYLQTRRPPGFAIPDDYFLRFRSNLKRAAGR